MMPDGHLASACRLPASGGAHVRAAAEYDCACADCVERLGLGSLLSPPCVLSEPLWRTGTSLCGENAAVATVVLIWAAAAQTVEMLMVADHFAVAEKAVVATVVLMEMEEESGVYHSNLGDGGDLALAVVTWLAEKAKW